MHYGDKTHHLVGKDFGALPMLVADQQVLRKEFVYDNRFTKQVVSFEFVEVMNWIMIPKKIRRSCWSLTNRFFGKNLAGDQQTRAFSTTFE